MTEIRATMPMSELQQWAEYFRQKQRGGGRVPDNDEVDLKKMSKAQIARAFGASMVED